MDVVARFPVHDERLELESKRSLASVSSMLAVATRSSQRKSLNNSRGRLEKPAIIAGLKNYAKREVFWGKRVRFQQRLWLTPDVNESRHHPFS
jgi:hypothetical protein